MENDPDIVSMIGASAALTISGAPFMGPIGAIKIGMIKDTFIFVCFSNIVSQELW